MKQHRAKEKNKLTHIELFIKLFNELGPSPGRWGTPDR